VFHVTGVQTCALPIFVPILSSWWLKDHTHSEEEGSSTNGKKKDGFMARVQRGYNNWVRRFMKRRKTVVGLYLVGSFSLVVLLFKIGRASCREGEYIPL